MLFWACFNKLELLVKQICDLENVYLEAPMRMLNNMTAFHACAFVNNEEALREIINREEIYFKNFNKKNLPNKFIFEISDNKIFRIFKTEEKIYDRKFKKKLELLAKWIYDFEKKVNINFILIKKILLISRLRN